MNIPNFNKGNVQATIAQLSMNSKVNMSNGLTTLRNRIPKQVQRIIPVYLALIFLVICLSNLDSLSAGSRSTTALFKREWRHQKPLGAGTLFPRKIWQTWKVGPLGFEQRDFDTARTWMMKNPGHRYEVLTDDNDFDYIDQHYGPEGFNRPDIVNFYKSINAKIVKADLLRYLVMYAEGGVYADIDVEALKPVDRFISDRWDEHEINMVIGIEIDQPEFNNHTILGKKSQSFCQWTFMCKPKLPVMLTLIEQIMTWLNGVARQQGKTVSDVVLDFDEVISGTGPSAFTTAVLADMSQRAGRPITWTTFHNMAESKLVSSTLVLTVEAFAAGQGHSDSGNHNARTALVKHHYHASGWPTNHPRYNHPVYGEVERCNWDADCVTRWDEDTAAFEELSSEEQAKMIADKEAADKEALAAQEALAVPPPPQGLVDVNAPPMAGLQPQQFGM